MRTTLPSGASCYIGQPEADSGRGLVLGPDVVGLRPLFEAMCDQIAAELGYVVACPEPFPDWPSLADTSPGTIPDAAMERFTSIDQERASAQAADYLAAAEATGCEQVAVMGFCLGGYHTYLAVASGAFAAGVSLYGSIVPPWPTSDRSMLPLEVLPDAARRTPTLAIIAGQDSLTPQSEVEQLQGIGGVEVEVFPDAHHAFVHDQHRDIHRPRDAARARVRAFDFIERSFSG